MGKKIAFIGAGSLGFTQRLARDILSFEAFRDAELCLMDIHDGRLGYAHQALEKTIAAGKYPAKVTSTTDRRIALNGADGVLITILQGGVEVWRKDVEIPEKYGVDINVGDTRGPSGIFRFLRTAPVMLEIIRDCEELCPDAVVLNYTNPMAMLCGYLQRFSKMNITGLCHSVQHTAVMLADFIGAPHNEISYTCAGINHSAFYLDYKWNAKDAYPLVRQAIRNNREFHDSFLNKKANAAEFEMVRNEMFLNLGYYITESSGHNSEYNAWFRKRPDLIEKYCAHGTGWNPGVRNYILNEYLEAEDTWEQRFKEILKTQEVDIARGNEYASYIFNAIFGDGTPFEFNGNLRNKGYIENLPDGCCVEIPVLASPKGIRPFAVGKLPEHLALMLNTSARIEELAIDAVCEGDPWKVFHAILFDPLTSAILSMSEIRDMVNELFQQNKDYLGYFKSLEIKL